MSQKIDNKKDDDINDENINSMLEKLIKNGGGGLNWQNQAIRTLTLSVILTREHLKRLNSKINVVMWLLASIMILIVVTLIEVVGLKGA